MKTLLQTDPDRLLVENDIQGELIAAPIANEECFLVHDIFYADTLRLYTNPANPLGSLLELNKDYVLFKQDTIGSDLSGFPCYRSLIFLTPHAAVYADYHVYGDLLAAELYNVVREEVDTALEELDAHKIATGSNAHGATTAAVAGQIMTRDSGAQAKVGVPTDPNHIIRLTDLQGEASARTAGDNALASAISQEIQDRTDAIDVHASAEGEEVHGSTPDADPEMIMCRDLGAQAKVGVPTDPNHIVRLTDLQAEATTREDVDATKAPLNSPALTGVPTAPTAATATNTTQIATTAFVKAVVAALVDSAPTTLDTLNELAAALGDDPNFATTMATALGNKQPLDATLTALAALATAANKLIYATGSDTFSTTDLTAFARTLLAAADAAAARTTLAAAPLASPALTGTPTAPTPATATDSTQIATTAFVKAVVAALVNSSPATLDTLNELATALGNDPNFATTITTALGGKQPLDATLTALAALATAANKLIYATGSDTFSTTDLTAFARTLLAAADAAAARTTLAAAPLASPAFTGTPTAPTPATATDSTQVATTAFVKAVVAALVNSSPATLDTLNELATALGNDPNFATTITTALSGKQPLDATLTALASLATAANKLIYSTGSDTFSTTDLTAFARTLLAAADAAAARTTLAAAPLASPAFTGTPTAPTPATASDNTQVATTAFVKAVVAEGGGGGGEGTIPELVWKALQRTLPVSGYWRAIAYGNGMYVALLAGTNVIATSPDGEVWTQRTIPISGAWYGIAFGNGIFVAVGDGPTGIVTSPDAENWTQQVFPTGGVWWDIAYGNGLFVVITFSDGRAFTSPNGVAWTQRDLPAVGYLSAIAFGNGKFVITPHNGAVALTSPDGEAWTQRNLPSSGQWHAIAFGNGLFVIMKAGTEIAATSPDGIDWTQRTIPISGSWEAVAHGNGLFVALSLGTADAVTSRDGIDWTQQSLPAVRNWSALAYGNGVFVATANETNSTAVITATAFPDDFALRQYESKPPFHSVLIQLKDEFRSQVESSSGGRLTAIYDKNGKPSIMYVVPKFRMQDIHADLGSGVFPAFVKGGVEKSEYFIGAYKAFNDGGLACSMPGRFPWVSINYDNAKAACSNKDNGTTIVGWHMATDLERAGLILWSLKEGHPQPRGNTAWGQAHDALWETAQRADGAIPGVASGNGATKLGLGPNSWRHNNAPDGVADLVGNVWEWAAGWKLVDGQIYVPSTFDNNYDEPEGSWVATGVYLDSTGTTGTDTVASINGAPILASARAVPSDDCGNGLGSGAPDYDYTHISGESGARSVTMSAGYDALPLATRQLMMRLMIAHKINGAAALPFAAKGAVYVRNYGERLPIRGGSWYYGADAGVAALNLYTRRVFVSSNIGFRPAFM